ncbi:MAG: hypothetical protein HY761_01125 [Candidatus Omnitrophica bacterium]|nr:hypothetical protein [Candidatus Omnitrophota bacterium]
MKLKLNKYWTEHLLKYPETGMGYQRVDVILKSGQVIKNIVVLNAEDLVLSDEYKDLRLDEIKDLHVLIKGKR